jgi:hypothetical protein
MKKLLFLLTVIFISQLSNAQEGYAFAYAFSTTEKAMYISFLEDVSQYTNCKEASYNTKLSVKDCLRKSFSESLKIEIGSTYYRYDITIVTKRNSSGYGSDEYFGAKEEGERKRKEVMADYSERGYKVFKLNM